MSSPFALFLVHMCVQEHKLRIASLPADTEDGIVLVHLLAFMGVFNEFLRLCEGQGLQAETCPCLYTFQGDLTKQTIEAYISLRLHPDWEPCQIAENFVQRAQVDRTLLCGELRAALPHIQRFRLRSSSLEASKFDQCLVAVLQSLDAIPSLPASATDPLRECFATLQLDIRYAVLHDSGWVSSPRRFLSVSLVPKVVRKLKSAATVRMSILTKLDHSSKKIVVLST